MGKLKTFILMLLLVLMFMWVGDLIGGKEGQRMAFWMALGINFFSYFFSDTLVLRHYHAQEIGKHANPELYDIVKRLADKAGVKMPKVYIVPEKVPNAFATGRNPNHAAVAVTSGLLDALNKNELEGVLAHEMSHIKHYDILISTIAAVFASAIGFVGNFARYGGNSNNQRKQNGILIVIGAILLPIAATIIRFSISRTREYAADAGAAELTEHPSWLISALQKLEDYARGNVLKNANNATAHMFIVSPFSGATLSALFSTHPSTKNRIERLSRMMKE